MMTSRERVWKTIHHQEPDRVPIGIGGTYVSGIHVDEYLEIGKYLGIDVELPRVYDTNQMLVRLEEPVRRWLHGDIIELENTSMNWGYVNKDWKPWTTTTGNRVLVPGQFNAVPDDNGTIRLYRDDGSEAASMSADGLYFDVSVPTGMSETMELMDPIKWKNSIPLYTDEELKIMEGRAKSLYDNTDYSIHGGFAKLRFGSPAWLFAGHTFTDWLCVLLTEEAYARDIIMATAEKARENVSLYLQAVGPYIDTILVSANDYGTQRGEMFNPDVFGSLYVPGIKLVSDCVHQYRDIKVMVHSCGSIRGLIPHFIDAGVDILNPVHFNTSNMDVRELKQSFGDKLVFWGGGVETQHTLPFGSEAEIAAEVKANVLTLGKNGGFIFAPTHNIQSKVPPKNIETAIKTVLQYGTYPIN
jgi:uroporphyrinogen decarboxylase